MCPRHWAAILPGLAFVAMAAGPTLSAAVASGKARLAVTESGRKIPVAYEADVVVVGGSTAGVAVAIAAAEQGAEVFLCAPRPYLGEDLCATYRLWLEEGETPVAPLARKLFAQGPPWRCQASCRRDRGYTGGARIVGFGP